MEPQHTGIGPRIRPSRIPESKITPSSIPESKITLSRIPESKITENRIRPNKLRITDKRIPSCKIIENRIIPNKIPEHKITEKCIIANLIRPCKITMSKIRPNEITAQRITDNRIRSCKIAANRIRPSKITEKGIILNRIRQSWIKPNRITASRITASRITANRITANRIRARRITARRIPPVWIPLIRVLEVLLLSLLCSSFCSQSSAERLCTVPPGPVAVMENNTVDQRVVQISAEADVTLTLTENPDDLFYLRGSDLLVKKGLDYEAVSSAALVVWVQCSRSGSSSVNESVEVLVENMNDNPPNFAQNHYTLEVNELTAVNSSVGLIEATDVDSNPLFYRLESNTDKYFRLESVTSPRVLVKSVLDYDLVQKVNMVLHVRDTFNGSASDEPFFTAVASVSVLVKDVDNRPPWFTPCQKVNLGNAKLCVSTGYKGRVNLTEKEEGPLVLEPGPVFARDGDKNRSEQISYKILRGNEGNIFQIDEDTGNISMAKVVDMVGPITLTVLASQVTNRDQFAVTQVVLEVMRKSRNPPRFEKERYEGFVYSNAVPESLILRDRGTNRPFRVRARDDDYAGGVNPDLKYEVQYSSYVNVTSDGFVILKRLVKTESFALQLRAVDSTTGEFGTAALSVQVIPAVAIPSPSNIGYRAGDMALLGLVMAALLVLCLIVIGFLISRLWKGSAGVDKICECLGPCLKAETQRSGHRDSLQYTNDGFQTEGDVSRGGARRWGSVVPRRSTFPQPRGRVIPLERRSRHCSSCGVYDNHVPAGSPSVRGSRRGRGDGDDDGGRSALIKQRRREGQKTVWFKESEDSSDIEVEIIPDSVGRVEEETQEELEAELEEEPEVEMEGVVRDPAAPRREPDENQDSEHGEEQEHGHPGSKTEGRGGQQEG